MQYALWIFALFFFFQCAQNLRFEQRTRLNDETVLEFLRACRTSFHSTQKNFGVGVGNVLKSSCVRSRNMLTTAWWRLRWRWKFLFESFSNCRLIKKYISECVVNTKKGKFLIRKLFQPYDNSNASTFTFSLDSDRFQHRSEAGVNVLESAVGAKLFTSPNTYCSGRNWQERVSARSGRHKRHFNLGRLRTPSKLLHSTPL